MTPQDLVGGHQAAAVDSGVQSAPPAAVAPAPALAGDPTPKYKPSGGIQTIRGTKVETVTVN